MNRKTQRHGVVLVDKPAGMTSQQVVSFVKRVLRARKAGHTGTLDPFATGLLPVCVGEATKASAFLLEADKRYRATLQLGAQTDTADLTGTVVDQKPVPALDEAQVHSALAQFVGEIEQLPPRYSALKKNGRPLYEYARAGIEVEIQPRRVQIHRLTLVALETDRLTFEVTCSKGTYVRTLGEDIARALGTVGHLSALRRLATGGLDVGMAQSLEAIEQAPEAALQPISILLVHLPVRRLPPELIRRFRHGNPVRIALEKDSPLYRVEDEAGMLAGIGQVKDGQLWPRRLFNL